MNETKHELDGLRFFCCIVNHDGKYFRRKNNEFEIGLCYSCYSGMSLERQNERQIKANETMLRRIRNLCHTPLLVSLFLLCALVSLLLLTSSGLHRSLSCISVSPSTGVHWQTIVNHTEDEQTSLDDLSIWCMSMGSRLDHEQYLPSSPILRSPPLDSPRLHRLPYRYSQWKSSPSLPRRITPCEHSLAMALLMIIERICRKNGIPMMMSDGTLLGSWRHHDLIPWDDDVDVMIPLRSRQLFVTQLNQINETSLKHYRLGGGENRKEYYKVFLRNTPSAGGYSWSFPFVDVFFYLNNATHLWQMNDTDTTMQLEHVFPLVMRPLGDIWLPAPRNPKSLFRFDPFAECKGHFWDHRNETGQPELSVPCASLQDIYPFVQRSNGSNSTEILRLHQTIIHTILYT